MRPIGLSHDRREFLKLLGAGVLLGPLHGCFSTARIQAWTRPAEHPNIVPIMADDMGCSDITRQARIAPECLLGPGPTACVQA